MKPVLYLCVFLTLLSCETYSTKDLERDNPYPFVLRVEVQNGGKKFLFEENNGRMYCDKLPSYEDCVPCNEVYGNSYWYDECVYNEKDGKYYTADSCMCKGYYHIVSQSGLEIILKDPKKVRTPSVFMTQIDGEIRYMNRPLNGRIMLTKSEIHTTIKQSGSSEVILTDSYFVDIAGGFEASDGDLVLSGGIFYSVKP